jgi:hypothetical protein
MTPDRQNVTYNPRKSRGTSGEAIRRLRVKRGLDRATPARSGVILLCFALELVYSGFNVFFSDYGEIREPYRRYTRHGRIEAESA